MAESIEQLSIIKLKDCLLRSKFLITEINESNTIPSWDGFIRLYKNEDKNKKKTDLLVRIPVQVKGELNSNIYSEEIKYQIRKSDLKNYLQDGGVIFFVVRIMDHDNFRIYYETLIPLKIKRYLKSIGKRKTKSVSLKTFPKDDINKFTDILFNFSYDMKKQPSDKFLSANEFEDIHPEGFDLSKFYFQVVSHKNLMDYFLDNEITIYVKHSTADIYIPVDFLSLNNYSFDYNYPILINTIEYYSCSVVSKIDKTKS
jgi:hypothetical protein